MTFPIGDGRVNPNPCSNEDWDQFAQDVSETLGTLAEGGVVDAFTFKETDGGTAGFWDEKVLGEDTYVEGTHQQVFYQINSGQVFMFTVAGGEGGGDTYQVKVAAGGASGFLDTKIHADSWEAVDTYGSGTHFVVLAANVSDSVRFYAPYNIIKNSAGDAAPGYLAAKFANAGSYSASTHILANFQDLGSTIRHFVAKSDIVTVVEALLPTVAVGNARFVKLTATTTVNGATLVGSSITPATNVAPEVVYNSGTGKWDTTGDNLTYQWIFPEAVFIPTGRFRVAEVLPAQADASLLMLQPPSCETWEEP